MLWETIPLFLPSQGQSLATPRAGAAGKGKVQEDSLGWGWGVPTGTPSFLPHSFHEEVYRSSVKVKPLASGIKARLWHLAMGATFRAAGSSLVK